MKRKLFWAFIAIGVLFCFDAARGQTSTPTPTRTLTPTRSPTSTRTCDLGLSMTASPLPARVGQELAYALQITNYGPSTCRDIGMLDTLPADVTFVSVTSSSFPPATCQTGATVNCVFNLLGAQGVINAVITVRPTKAGQITNSAQVLTTGGDRDPNVTNNTATVTTDVLEAISTSTPTPTRSPSPTPTSHRVADLSLTKVASSPSVQVGQPLTYTLTVHNNGPSMVPLVVLRDTLPADVTFVSVAGPEGACSGGGASVQCQVRFMSAGHPWQAVIVVKTTKAGRITNSAVVQGLSGGQGTFVDPNQSNNVATVTTDVEGSLAFLRGSGAAANPPVLYLDRVAPTAASAKYKDSAAVRSGLTNPWVEVGTWSGQPSLFAGTLSELPDLHAWLGLKNSDDWGTRFDLRAEVWKNGLELVASGETLCVQGINRNPDEAKHAAVPFALFPPVSFNGTTDVLSLRVLTRIGTGCAGHGSATGLRLYFDGEARPSGLGVPPE